MTTILLCASWALAYLAGWRHGRLSHSRNRTQRSDDR